MPQTGMTELHCVLSTFLVGFVNYSLFLLILLKIKLLHESVYQKVLDRLVDVYKQVKIGDPLEIGTLLGPLHSRTSKENFEKGIQVIKSQVCPVYCIWKKKKKKKKARWIS